jgi:hypothetical protein
MLKSLAYALAVGLIFTFNVIVDVIKWPFRAAHEKYLRDRYPFSR